MKIKYIILFFILIYSNLYAQSEKLDERIVYSADNFGAALINPKGEELGFVPMGKNTTIFYDKFFKSYSIWYRDKDGYDRKWDLSFIVKDGECLKMKDKFDNHFTLCDMINERNLIIIIFDKKTEAGNSKYCEFKNITLSK